MTSIRNQYWRDLAACRAKDPELFFPVGTTGPALAQIEAAKAVCASCPVARPCLAFAREKRLVGIWGGLTDDERTGVAREERNARRRVDRGKQETPAA